MHHLQTAISGSSTSSLVSVANSSLRELAAQAWPPQAKLCTWDEQAVIHPRTPRTSASGKPREAGGARGSAAQPESVRTPQETTNSPKAQPWKPRTPYTLFQPVCARLSRALQCPVINYANICSQHHHTRSIPAHHPPQYYRSSCMCRALTQHIPTPPSCHFLISAK